MVHAKSSVLPLAAAFPSNSDFEPSLADDANTISASRSSRPCLDDGWLDEDNCYQSVDEPADSHVANEWKEKYHDLDKIRVNGAMKRQWMRGREEIQQLTTRCEDIIGKRRVYGKNTSLNTSLGKTHLYLMHVGGASGGIILIFSNQYQPASDSLPISGQP